MTNDLRRAMLTDKFWNICKQIRARGWDGPKFTSPEDTLEHQARFGTPIRPKWELWMEKSVPDSHPPHDVGQPIRAAVHLTDTEVANLSGEEIAYRLAGAVAGREAHEAFEWFRFGGRMMVDPHGDSESPGDAAHEVALYLMKAATRPATRQAG